MNTAFQYPFFLEQAPRILIIDDDRVMRMQLRFFLEKEHYQVVEATQGEEGLASFQGKRPDLVLMDAKMPVMDGFECCVRLRQLSGEVPTPVLMITGLDNRESVDRAFQVGASDYVTKPIHWAVLRQRVRRLIEQSHLYQQLVLTNHKLEEANQQLHRLASLDGLTQVANRRHFDESFQREWQRSMREATPLSLLMCDVDFFKNFNDLYGHLAGDSCLKRIAETISQTLKRPTDLIARYGGEEFVVLLPNTSLPGAHRLAETIRVRVRELIIPHSGSSDYGQITISIGVASGIPLQDSSCHQLIRTADLALYQAKSLGRDRVVSELCLCSTRESLPTGD